MSAIPTIVEADIERLVGRRSLRSGQEYFENRAVVDAYRQDLLLKGSCLGSKREPYHVEVRFDDRTVASAHCSCPVGKHGHCKHVAALLLCWVQSPETFKEASAWEEALGRYSRRQLLDILRQLVQQQPGLKQSLAAIVPEEERHPAEPAPEIADRVAAAIREAEAGSGGRAPLADALAAVKQSGDALAQGHEPAAAAEVYLAILVPLLERPELLHQHASELGDLLQEAADALAGLLAHLSDDPQLRLKIFRTLLDLYCADMAVGLPGGGGELSRVLLEQADRDERPTLADWIRARLPAAKSRADRRVLGGLLQQLLGPDLEDDLLLDLCRQSDRIFDLVRRLVQRGRLEEAAEAAADADDEELLKIAELLVRQRRDELALRLIRRRVEVSPQPLLQQWIEDYQSRQHDRLAMLELCQRLFRMEPTLAAYRQLRGLARQLGRWDAVRGELLAHLQRAGHLSLLIRIHLEENDLDRALEVVASDVAAEDSVLALRVARAAERSRPVESLAIYRKAAERLIARRGTENYAEACRYLRKVRGLMRRAGDASGWNAYLAALQRRYRGLRAFQKELETARITAEEA